MRLFVTGGTGFIGSYFLRCALQDGHVVRALRRPGSATRIPLQQQPDWIQTPLDELTHADLEGVDAIVHFASVGVSPQEASWSDLMYWNVAATVRLLEQASLANVKRIVIAGTFAEYGKSADDYEKIPWNASLFPTYAYAASKAAAYQAAVGFAFQEGIELCYLRIFSAYGEGQFEGNFWPALHKAALDGRDFPMTPGEQVRDYIPVESVAAQFLNAAARKDIGENGIMVRNVGSGSPVSMKAFAEHWWQRWHARGHLICGALSYRPNEIMRFVPEILDDDAQPPHGQ